MILTFTDFGSSGPYLAQMHAAIRRIAPSVPILDLLSDAPLCNPKASAYLLAALVPQFPRSSIFLGVVDPGVGSERKPVIVNAGDYWFIGPDNGLFEIAARRSGIASWWELDMPVHAISASFHGRDLFAPAAAKLVSGQGHEGEPTTPIDCDWPDDLPEIIYIDHYGNAMTGLRADNYDADVAIQVGEEVFQSARTFADVPLSESFWYKNSIGLIELASNQASCAELHQLVVGQPLSLA